MNRVLKPLLGKLKNHRLVSIDQEEKLRLYAIYFAISLNAQEYRTQKYRKYSLGESDTRLWL